MRPESVRILLAKTQGIKNMKTIIMTSFGTLECNADSENKIMLAKLKASVASTIFNNANARLAKQEVIKNTESNLTVIISSPSLPWLNFTWQIRYKEGLYSLDIIKGKHWKTANEYPAKSSSLPWLLNEYEGVVGAFQHLLTLPKKRKKQGIPKIKLKGFNQLVEATHENQVRLNQLVADNTTDEEAYAMANAEHIIERAEVYMIALGIMEDPVESVLLSVLKT